MRLSGRLGEVNGAGNFWRGSTAGNLRLDRSGSFFSLDYPGLTRQHYPNVESRTKLPIAWYKNCAVCAETWLTSDNIVGHFVHYSDSLTEDSRLSRQQYRIFQQRQILLRSFCRRPDAATEI
jgi:hypothetical protein